MLAVGRHAAVSVSDNATANRTPSSESAVILIVYVCAFVKHEYSTYISLLFVVSAVWRRTMFRRLVESQPIRSKPWGTSVTPVHYYRAAR